MVGSTRLVSRTNGVFAKATQDVPQTEELIGYLERNRPNIPCYAVRKRLGLRNSSQLGEKMNDVVVADRQKHRGMSWSVAGSTALASLTALVKNGEVAHWLKNGTLEFKLAA